MAHSSAHVTTPAIYPNAPYDTVEDFAAVAAFGSSPNVTVVAPEKGIKTLQQLVAAAKAKPGSITFGRAGRLHLLDHRHRTAFHPRGQARGARGEHAPTLVRAARRADHDRGRLQEFRLHVLDRAVRAGQDTARDR